MLNRNNPESPSQDENEERREELEISVKPPTTQEIMAALKTIRNWIVPRADQITAEILKADHDQTNQELKHTFDKCGRRRRCPRKGPTKATFRTAATGKGCPCCS